MGQNFIKSYLPGGGRAKKHVSHVFSRQQTPSQVRKLKILVENPRNP